MPFSPENRTANQTETKSETVEKAVTPETLERESVSKLDSLADQVSGGSARFDQLNRSVGLSLESLEALKNKLGIGEKLDQISGKVRELVAEAKARIKEVLEGGEKKTELVEERSQEATGEDEGSGKEVVTAEEAALQRAKRKEDLMSKGYEWVTKEALTHCEVCGRAIFSGDGKVCKTCGHEVGRPKEEGLGEKKQEESIAEQAETPLEEVRPAEGQVGLEAEKKDLSEAPSESVREAISRSEEGAPENEAAETVAEMMESSEDPDLNPEAAKIEVFDPEVELKNIRTGTREEQKQKLARFKEQLILQRRHLANINKGIIASFEQNPRINPGEYFAYLQEYFNHAKLSEKQREAVKAVIDSFAEQGGKVASFLEQYRTGENGELDPAGVYEGLFGKKPSGRIEVIPTGVSIQLRIEDINDYAFITSRKYSSDPGAALTEDEVARASRTAGMKMLSRLRPDLGGSIILENCSRPGRFDTKDEFSEETRKHEQQHVYNGLMEKAYNADKATAEKRGGAIDARVDKNIEEINKRVKDGENVPIEEVKGVTEQSKIMWAESRRLRNNAFEDAGIKDEIAAYFTENDDPNPVNIRSTLLGQDSIYEDYNQRYKAREGSDGKRGKYSEEYMKKVEDGITAFFRMLQAGYPKEDVLALMYNEPLGSWGRMADRFIGSAGNKNELKKTIRGFSEEGEIRMAERKIDSVRSIGEFLEIVRNLPPLPGADGKEIDPTAVVQVAKELTMAARHAEDLGDLDAWKEGVTGSDLLLVGSEKIRQKFLELLSREGAEAEERLNRKKEEIESAVAGVSNLNEFIGLIRTIGSIPNLEMKGSKVNKDAIEFFAYKYFNDTLDQDPEKLKELKEASEKGELLPFAKAYGIRDKFNELLKKEIDKISKSAEAEEGKKKCRNCGGTISSDSSFCEHCGAKQ